LDRRGTIIIGWWRTLHIEELHNIYSSPNIIRMMKSRRMRWAGNVARIKTRGIHIGYWGEAKRKQTTRKKNVDGWIILKWILER
jgi:hypothetical protein